MLPNYEYFLANYYSSFGAWLDAGSNLTTGTNIEKNTHNQEDSKWQKKTDIIVNLNQEWKKQKVIQALIAGKGVGTGQGNENFYAKDWGVLMCIYHSVPLLDYVISAPDPQLFASMNTSFPVPELDAIGLEPITVAYYSNNPIELPSTGGITDSPTTTVGFPRLS